MPLHALVSLNEILTRLLTIDNEIEIDNAITRPSHLDDDFCSLSREEASISIAQRCNRNWITK